MVSHPYLPRSLPVAATAVLLAVASFATGQESHAPRVPVPPPASAAPGMPVPISTLPPLRSAEELRGDPPAGDQPDFAPMEEYDSADGLHTRLRLRGNPYVLSFTNGDFAPEPGLDPALVAAWRRDPDGHTYAYVMIEGRMADAKIEALQQRGVSAARLQHPCIVPIYDVGQADGTHWFAMELVAGRNLAQALTELPTRPLRATGDGHIAQATEIVARVAEALHHAHEQRVLHRDVKPHNILLGDDDSVRLVDFGLARDDDRHHASRSGEFAGTPHYASPEQLAGSKRALDGRSDVFSLGVVLYELLSGARPFDGETTQQIVDQIRTRDPRPLRSIAPRVPHDLQVVCHKALEKEALDRYQSAGEFAADLRRFLALEPIVAEPPGPLSRLAKAVRRNRLRATIGVLAAILVIGTPYALWQHSVSLHRRDRQHLAQTRRLLREAVDVLGESKLKLQPGSEGIYLERVQRLAALYRESLREAPTDPTLILEAAQASMRLAQALNIVGDPVRAIAEYDHAVAALSELDRLAPPSPHIRITHAAALHDRALL
jgi:hypothetical protein